METNNTKGSLYIDYVFIGTKEDITDSQLGGDVNENEILSSLGKGRYATKNGRYLRFAIGGEIQVIPEKIHVKKCEDNGYLTTDISDEIAISRLSSDITVDNATCFEVITDQSNAGMIIADSNKLEIGTGKTADKYPCAGITSIIYVDFNPKVFIPLKVYGATTVVDSWYRGGINGFVAALYAQNSYITIEGIELATKTYTRIEIPSSRSALGVTTGLYPPKAVATFKKMEHGNTIYPVMPKKSGFAPSNVVLCSKDLDNAKVMVEKALANYPHLAGYGTNINTFEVVDNGTEWDFVNPDKVQYHMPRHDINIVKIPVAQDYDAGDYTKKLIDFWNDKFVWRFNVPVRALTILMHDSALLPLEFRKNAHIRYVDRITKDGKVFPFITNKF
jgi:hypothetical protein